MGVIGYQRCIVSKAVKRPKYTQDGIENKSLLLSISAYLALC